MKAFRFRLDQALRWRAAQVEVEKSKVAMATADLAKVRAERQSLDTQLADSAAQLAADPNVETMHSWTAWKARCTREMGALDQRATAAAQLLHTSMQRLAEANRNVELLRKLETAGRCQWQLEAGRELEAFAGETFLRQVTIKKRTGA